MATRPKLVKLQKATRLLLAANLKLQRQRHHLTQEKAAEEVGLSLQYLQRIERCIVNVPLDTLVRFARGYGVEPADLLKQPGRQRNAE
jgi:transcriptional regulator with XRE-family HTH domain